MPEATLQPLCWDPGPAYPARAPYRITSGMIRIGIESTNRASLEAESISTPQLHRLSSLGERRASTKRLESERIRGNSQHQGKSGGCCETGTVGLVRCSHLLDDIISLAPKSRLAT